MMLSCAKPRKQVTVTITATVTITVTVTITATVTVTVTVTDSQPQPQPECSVYVIDRRQQRKSAAAFSDLNLLHFFRKVISEVTEDGAWLPPFSRFHS